MTNLFLTSAIAAPLHGDIYRDDDLQEGKEMKGGQMKEDQM